MGQRDLSSLSLLAFNLRSFAGWYDSLHLSCRQREVCAERHLNRIVAALDLLAVCLPVFRRRVFIQSRVHLLLLRDRDRMMSRGYVRLGLDYRRVFDDSAHT